MGGGRGLIDTSACAYFKHHRIRASSLRMRWNDAARWPAQWLRQLIIVAHLPRQQSNHKSSLGCARNLSHIKCTSSWSSGTVKLPCIEHCVQFCNDCFGPGTSHAAQCAWNAWPPPLVLSSAFYFIAIFFRIFCKVYCVPFLWVIHGSWQVSGAPRVNVSARQKVERTISVDVSHNWVSIRLASTRVGFNQVKFFFLSIFNKKPFLWNPI